MQHCTLSKSILMSSGYQSCTHQCQRHSSLQKRKKVVPRQTCPKLGNSHQNNIDFNYATCHSLIRIGCVKLISRPGSQCSVLAHCLTFRGSESFVLLLVFSCVNVQKLPHEPICMICSAFSVFSSPLVC